MTRGKTTKKYTQAGTRMVPGQRMRFMSGVQIGCSEIGETSDSDVYIATEEEKKRYQRKLRGVSRNTAAMILGVITFAMMTVILFKVGYRISLNSSIIDLQEQVFTIENEIREQKDQIAEARDSGRICYKAVQEMGMVNSSGADTVRITLQGKNAFTYVEGNPAGYQTGANHQ